MPTLVRWFIDVTMWALALFGLSIALACFASILLPVEALFAVPLTKTHQLVTSAAIYSAVALCGFAYLALANRGKFGIAAILAIIAFIAVELALMYSEHHELRVLNTICICLFCVCWPTWKHFLADSGTP